MYQKTKKTLVRVGTNQKKLLLMIAGGLTLLCVRSPRQYFRVIESVRKGVKDIEKRGIESSINALYTSKLLESVPDSEGRWKLILSEQGKKRALSYNLECISIPPLPVWDEKWRVVLFDIPEKKKRIRESVRFHLRSMGFYEFQKSVFVHPYPCKDEIDYVIEFYDVRKHIRTMTALEIDNEIEIQKHFGLL